MPRILLPSLAEYNKHELCPLASAFWGPLEKYQDKSKYFRTERDKQIKTLAKGGITLTFAFRDNEVSDKPADWTLTMEIPFKRAPSGKIVWISENPHTDMFSEKNVGIIESYIGLMISGGTDPKPIVPGKAKVKQSGVTVTNLATIFEPKATGSSSRAFTATPTAIATATATAIQSSASITKHSLVKKTPTSNAVVTTIVDSDSDDDDTASVTSALTARVPTSPNRKRIYNFVSSSPEAKRPKRHAAIKASIDCRKLLYATPAEIAKEREEDIEVENHYKH